MKYSLLVLPCYLSQVSIRLKEWEILERQRRKQTAKKKKELFVSLYIKHTKTKVEVRLLLPNITFVKRIFVFREGWLCGMWWDGTGTISSRLSWSGLLWVPPVLLYYCWFMKTNVKMIRRSLPCLLSLLLPPDPGDINIRFSHNIGRICEIIFLGINYQHLSWFSIFTNIFWTHIRLQVKGTLKYFKMTIMKYI